MDSESNTEEGSITGCTGEPLVLTEKEKKTKEFWRKKRKRQKEKKRLQQESIKPVHSTYNAGDNTQKRTLP